MRRAIAAEFASLPGCRVITTLDHRLGERPGPWSVAEIGPGEEDARVPELAAGADYTVLVAPETGGILEARTRALTAAGARLLGSLPEGVALAGNKLKLAAHLAQRNLPTPPTQRVMPAEGLPTSFHYPAVLKPIDGAGSVDTFLVFGADEVPREARALPEAILQPMMPGIAMSASILVDRNGVATVIGHARQRVSIHDARFHYDGGILPIGLAGLGPLLGKAVRSVDGLRGFIGVDFLWDEAGQTATILEINPRPTTSIVGWTQVLAQGRLARAWVAAVEGAIEENERDFAAELDFDDPLTFLPDGTSGRGSGGFPP
jgi:predicted ATP-grasp superfamily ATP-dependent carboligase